jgi:signal transduction histidine kinase
LIQQEMSTILKILAIPVHQSTGLSRLLETGRELFDIDALSLTDAWGQVLASYGNQNSPGLSIPLDDGANLSLSRSTPFSPTESQLLTIFAERAALLVEYLTLKTSLEAERQQRVIANTLQDISLILTSQHDLETVFHKILEQIARVLPYDAASVWLIEDGESRIIANLGHENIGLTKIRFRVESNALLREIVETKRVLILSDVQTDPRWQVTEEHKWIQSWASAPIIVNEKVIGQFTLDHSELNFYQQSHRPILEVLSRQMSIAARNAQLFEALHQSQRELEISLQGEKELNQLKSRFITTVSHEFRTPLASILANSQIIERYSKRLSDEQKSAYHAKIKGQIHYLTNLVEDVLLASKGDSIGFTLEIDRQDLKAFCEEIISELRLIAPGNVELSLELHGNSDTLAFDSKLLRHILFNLLSNAVKYSPQGGRVCLRVNAKVRIFSLIVSDEGIGIPSEDKDKLFQTFFRASNAGRVSGTGLGLTIVKHAVEAYGGQIAVRSQAKKGTIVEVKLPRYATLTIGS